MLITRGPRGRISTTRMRWVAAVVVIATLLALLQQTSWAPLPHEHDSTMAGIAAGAVFMGLVVYLYSYLRRSP